MKKKGLRIIITLFAASYNFSSSANNLCFEETSKQDTIKVEFGNQFILYWDCVNSEIIQDKNFYEIAKGEKNARSLAYFITNQEIVCDSVWGKETSLKKGDIAYLFLTPPYSIYISHSCLECCSEQFDFHGKCGYPYGLLDYIEKNRNDVFQKVMDCLDRNIEEVFQVKDSVPSGRK